MYIDLREVVLPLYHQTKEELEPSTFPKRNVKWEEHYSESGEEDIEREYGSGDNSAHDDADHAQVASQHPFGEPSFMHALDLQAMHITEFPEYANMGM